MKGTEEEKTREKNKTGIADTVQWINEEETSQRKKKRKLVRVWEEELSKEEKKNSNWEHFFHESWEEKSDGEKKENHRLAKTQEPFDREKEQLFDYEDILKPVHENERFMGQKNK